MSLWKVTCGRARAPPAVPALEWQGAGGRPRSRAEGRGERGAQSE